MIDEPLKPLLVLGLKGVRDNPYGSIKGCKTDPWFRSVSVLLWSLQGTELNQSKPK